MVFCRKLRLNWHMEINVSNNRYIRISAWNEFLFFFFILVDAIYEPSAVDVECSGTSTQHSHHSNTSIFNETDVEESIDDSEVDPDYETDDASTASTTDNEKQNLTTLNNTETRKSRKIKRNKGLQYTTKKGRIIPARTFRPLGVCQKRCAEKIEISDQKEIFEKYWEIQNFNSRLLYCSGLVSMTNTKITLNKKHLRKPRNRPKTFKYYLEIHGERVHVCKKCFQNTLDESNRFLKTILAKKMSNTPLIDMRGKSVPKNKIPEHIISQIKQFFNDFPSYESHYTRRDTSKRYFSADLTITKLYELYTVKYGTIISLTKFSEIFKEMDIKFKKPKVDTCNKCDIFNIKISLTDEAEKLNLKEQLKQHQTEADNAYKMKSVDKEASKHEKELKVFTFDLQKCLPTPFLQTNVAFYKRSLWTFNLTVHDCETNEASNFMWHEIIANRGGNEIASCLLKHLKSLEASVERIIFYSDSCAGQNKNSFLASMFLLFVYNSDTVDSIEHKFLTSGHTHMECDTVHAAIERNKKKTSMKIHHPRDWMNLVQSTSKKYKVIEMNQQDIYDFSLTAKTKFVFRKVATNEVKFSWRHVKWLKYTKDIGIIQFKNTLDEEEPFQILKIKKRGINDFQLNNTSLCYTTPIQITKAKKKDIIDMLDLVDPIFHDFYKNLPTSEELLNFHPDLTEHDDESG